MNGRMKSLHLLFSLLAQFLFFPSAPAYGAIAFRTLHFFDATNGANPYGGLVFGNESNMYGTTAMGGSLDGITVFGGGTIFKITSEGGFASLRSFAVTNGDGPGSPLVKGQDGSFYGTTTSGGASGSYGTVFKFTSEAGISLLHSFNGGDGAAPYVPLIQGSDGAFYGTTTRTTNQLNSGTLFRITTSGEFTNLHFFNDSGGGFPYSGLVEGLDGDFYGTVYGLRGGHDRIFKITATGILSNMHVFNGLDGAAPTGSLCLGSDGNFYGTTFSGGVYGLGTIFAMTADGTFTNLHSFGGRDGAGPYAALIEGSRGVFYGTTTGGGTNVGSFQGGNGTIFRIRANGHFTSLHSFNGFDGANCEGSLVRGTDGAFYGTTFSLGENGNNGSGTVFKFTLAPSPAPLLYTAKRTGETTELAYSVVPGESYQLQYISRLNSGNWANLRSPILAVAESLTASDTTSDEQRFYRIMLLTDP
jgi:uncharacterized repeat protein (TIGR03803 family)